MDNSDKYFAHTVAGFGKEHWEPLEDHLRDVAELAEEFAAAFNAADWGRLAGQWHDLGKYSKAFQRLLNAADPDAGEESVTPGRVDHSTFGARYAKDILPKLPGQLLAFCIAGHHAGLADATPLGERGTLSFRLNKDCYAIEPVELAAEVPVPPKLRLPQRISSVPNLGFSIGFFGRMIFSCLIDADRSATEKFCKKAQWAERNKEKPKLAQLRVALDSYLGKIQSRDTAVNRIRTNVLEECLSGAPLPPGFFSLNVPTGGGKTLASLAFALHHAAAHPSLRRVVVAIPFTSIIEQTADAYRKALGDLSHLGLIEHHSNLNPLRETRDNKLASENWNAPLIVTTNVQLFESLFSSKGTPARKLHRLANSVIILDEAQTIPVDLLAPTLLALKELVAGYGCSVVLCTATQPALEKRAADFSIGIEKVRLIVADVERLHEALRRVSVERLGKLDDQTLAGRLCDERQVLCVVNTKRHASELFIRLSACDEDGCFHLSTFMCPQHRRETLERIRERLARKQVCRVVSTQLIEAGVDVDFACVYRAAAGFDSIAQSAGRCNREGKLRDDAGAPMLGRVYVFDAETPPPVGMLRTAANVAAEIADQFPDPIDPAAIHQYFKLLYWTKHANNGWDRYHVLANFDFDPHHIKEHRDLAPFNFRTAALAYRLINDVDTPVLVPYNDEAKKLVAHLLSGGAVDYAFYKAAQAYSVGVRQCLLEKLVDNTTAIRHESDVWYLANENAYSPELGMTFDVAGVDPDNYIC